MCGLAGYLNRDGRPASATVARAMATMIAHRGPDDEGVYTDRCLALGHRRLSIIDVTTAGHQPMMSADGRYVVVYNGAVYNYQELRAQLQASGHRFVSNSDTEVLLHGFVTWGADVVERLNGMFAFAIWDMYASRLFLARDRYGIKPLYVCERGSSLLFASEVKAFFAHPEFRCTLDREALVEYFTFQNYFTSRTLFDGVEVFPAGHYQWVDLLDQKRERDAAVRYWDYRFRQPAVVGDRREYVEELDRLVVQAVERQLVSDVEIGSFLSGGIDSGSIAAVAAKALPNLKTFTVGFDLRSASGLEVAFDERSKAEYMSYVFGTEQYEMVLKAGDMQRSMRPLVWHLEEPRVGQSYPNFYAAKLASRFCKVVMAGAGGDEMFGGYPWRYYRAVVNDDFEHYVDKYFDYWKRMVPPSIMPDLLSPLGSLGANVDLRSIFANVFQSHAAELDSPQAYVNHSLYFEARTFLPGLLLVEDKLGMAHGIETRVPFLDNDLVDFAMSLPVETKLGNLDEVVSLNENEPGPKTQRYFEKTRDGKLVLRDAMRRYVPGDVAEDIKQGFSAPDASWFKGESIAYVRERLMGEDAAIFEYLDRKTVQRLVGDHLSGQENRRLLIWSLLNVEEWLDVFIAGAGVNPGDRPAVVMATL
ncbi:MAG: asparagine synthase (glutamine-hydrolyzing) [Gammaproteobacteria bacterium]|nr:asparagine synthase (glutamine-hydrolyzing) [Gammaproteobacteria bacterium]